MPSLCHQQSGTVLEAAWTYHNAPHEAFSDLSSIVADTKRKIESDQPATGGHTLTREIPGMTDVLVKAWGWDRVLTLEEKEEEEHQERIGRSRDAWADPNVQKIAKSRNILE